MRLFTKSMINKVGYSFRLEKDRLRYHDSHLRLHTLFKKHALLRSTYSIPYYWSTIVLVLLRNMVNADSDIIIKEINDKNGKLVVDYFASHISNEEEIDYLIATAQKALDSLLHDRIRGAILNGFEDDSSIKIARRYTTYRFGKSMQ